MWWRLILNSFRRDPRKKMVAISAVALATCLATFLLNWSLNLGDKIQKDLRAYGANILITPQGESLAPVAGNVDLSFVSSDRYLKSSEIPKLKKIFWTNQILAYAPLLPEPVSYQGSAVVLVGTEFGRARAISNLPKAAPYLSLRGKWPAGQDEVVVGAATANKFGWRIGDSILLDSADRQRSFQIVGIVRSGGLEEHQILAELKTVQDFTRRPDSFKQLVVSALVTPQNNLYYKCQRNPKALTSQEFERFSCTPYISSVAEDIRKVFTGAEARVVRQVSQTEEKVVGKVNRLMILVTLAALVASSLTMTSTTTGMILERRKELALMKAIGSSNGLIVFYLFAEIIILGMLGSLIGYGLGSLLSMGLSRAIFQSVFELKWIVLPMVFFVGLLIVLAGSAWPLRQTFSLEPAQALKDL